MLAWVSHLNGSKNKDFFKQQYATISLPFLDIIAAKLFQNAAEFCVNL